MRSNYRRRAFLELIEPDHGSSFRCLHAQPPEGFPFSWHYHPEVELTLITQGSGLRLVGDSIAEFVAGDLCLLGPDLPHTWSSSVASRAIVVQFDPRRWEPALGGLPEWRPIRRLLEACSRGLFFPPPADRPVAERLHQMVRLAPSDLRRWQLLIECLDLLATPAPASASPKRPSGPSKIALLRVASGDENPKSRISATPLASLAAHPSVRGPAGQRLQRILQHIQADLGRHETQRSLARAVGLSPQGFSRFFRRQVGVTFVEYLNRWRISMACRALIETDDPITVIAWRCGFRNLSNFNRRFQRLKNMTPRTYRRQALTQ